MTSCPNCGYILGPVEQPTLRAVRGPLTITCDPPAVYWHGIRHRGLSPKQHQLLFLLTLRGEATHEVMQGFIDASAKCVAVHLTRARDWLRHEAIGVKIENIHRWGYRMS